MWIFIIFVILNGSLNFFNMPIILTKLSTQAQLTCTELVNVNSKNQTLIDALICGKNISSAEKNLILQKTSLIHLFVVSGSHFIVLNLILLLLLPRHTFYLFVRLIILFLFCILSGMSPPATRGLLMILSSSILNKMPSDILTLIIGLICLCLFPRWVTSYSLLLSWYASLALCWSFLFYNYSQYKKILFTQIIIFIFMSIPLSFTFSLHPLSIIFNLLFAHLLGFILFPLAILTALIPKISFLFDAINSFLFSLLEKISFSIPTYSTNFKINFLFLWTVLFILHLFTHIYRIHHLRKVGWKIQ